MTINYYYDPGQAFCPFTHSLPANPGTLPPVNATRLEPEFAANFWPCWNGENWYLVEDHRQTETYDKATGAATKTEALGPLPANLTIIPKPGPAYRWGGGDWIYDPGLDPPSPDHVWDEPAGRWVKIRFTKKEFLLLCGIPQVAGLNAAINAGNVMAKTVHDLLFASEYIDVTDQATIQMVGLLTTEEAGSVLTAAQAAEILKGAPYVAESEN